jgi:hydroxyethylthiazole kinase-like uncharacterized protein yjeF
MPGVWRVEQVRAAEEALMAQLPEGALMQRAATGLARHCVQLLGRVYGARVVLLVGAGNNGGDALYAGARLAARGAAVSAVLLAPDRAHAGGLARFRASGGRVVAAEPTSLTGAELVLDGIVGIGGHGGLRPDAATLAAAAAGSGATLVAVDLPSGVDADTGVADGEFFDADVTVTFGCLKPGLVVGAGARAAGKVELVDIGLRLPPADLQVLDDAAVAALLPHPGPNDDKYTRGVLGVVAGSPTYGGAAVLAVGSALRTGAGMVRYAGRATDAVRTRWPEVVVNEGGPEQAGRVQAWAVGPGLGTDDAADADLRAVLAADVPTLVDADGITLLARHRDLNHSDLNRSDLNRRDLNRSDIIITPHDREFERIAGDIGSDRLGAARRAAAELGVTVLLKGNATVVAAPDGRAYANPTGTPWLAAAGTGDVLSGCVGALLAAGLTPLEAGAVGAYLHGRAGQLAGHPLLAHDLIDSLPKVIQAVTGR